MMAIAAGKQTVVGAIGLNGSNAAFCQPLQLKMSGMVAVEENRTGKKKNSFDQRPSLPHDILTGHRLNRAAIKLFSSTPGLKQPFGSELFRNLSPYPGKSGHVF